MEIPRPESISDERRIKSIEPTEGRIVGSSLTKPKTEQEQLKQRPEEQKVETDSVHDPKKAPGKGKVYIVA